MFDNKLFFKQKKTIILQNILYEDNYILIINKPNGIAVHGGNIGIIEIMKQIFYKIKSLELVHRIDKDTSGILLLAKKRLILKELHKQLRYKEINKEYLALVHGTWTINNYMINLPILKYKYKSIVQINQGKTSITYINVYKIYKEYTLLKIKLVTGRTHQIRVHLSYLGYPIVLDTKYGNKKLDNNFVQTTFINTHNYIFLHAYSLSFLHPNLKKHIKVFAPLNNYFTNALKILN